MPSQKNSALYRTLKNS